jgi:hypothetical protein
MFSSALAVNRSSLGMLGKKKEKINQIKYLFRSTCYLFMPILVANFAVWTFDKVVLQDPDLDCIQMLGPTTDPYCNQ